MHVLVIDNYDSFVYTIVGYLQQLGARTTVVRPRDVPPAPERAGFDGVLVSPGPGTPGEATASCELIRWCAETGTPMLGVCLGHQALAEVFGATVGHAPELMHGKTSVIDHDGDHLFDGLPQPLTVTRYHSLAVAPETVPDELVVTATTASGIIMGLRHRDRPLYGVQFHPESVLTEGGHRLFANWLERGGLIGAVDRSAGMAPLVSA